MPYGLIPDGYTLKKITKQEEDALKDLKRHDNVEALLNNPNTPLIIGAGAFLVFTPLLMKVILDKLQEEGVTISDTLYDQLMTRLPYSVPALFIKGVQGAPGVWDAFREKDEELEAFVRGLFTR